MGDMQGSFLPLGLFLTALGCFLVGAELVQMVRTVAASKWPSVDGEIEATGVAESVDNFGYQGSREVVFHPVVRYRYRLWDGTHTSERLGFEGLVSRSLGAAQRTTNRYPPGSAVKVYVSPRDPTYSVIEVRLQWSHWLGLAIGAVVLGVGTTMIMAHFGIDVRAWVTSGTSAAQ